MISELRARDGHDSLGQGADGHFLVRADIEDLAHCGGLLHQGDQGADDVAHVGETARLAAIAMNGDRPAGEGLLDERGNDHAVLPGLARADRVKQSNNHRRQLAAPRQ